jgi:hypothetical protein
MIVSWFSAGVSSAIATKLMIKDIDKIIYTHIDDQHPDTLRFVGECEDWFEKKVEIIQSPYKSVNNACMGASYVNGVHGAACTRLLKRRVRQEWEMDITVPISYVWGMDVTESDRCERIRQSMPNVIHFFPLLTKGIGKNLAHEMLTASGIKRPKMYDLGYNNNNCIGCVKGGKGYWNKIRVDFPEVFKARAEMERIIGGTCIKGVYLDELDQTVGHHSDFIFDECGLFCETMAL